jgi:membrane associated rhomboid family serine protease
MQRPPPLKNCLLYPVTTCIGLSAVIVTLWWWSGADINGMMMNYLAFRTEPWRLVTCALPHGDILHLLFNLCVLWAFGTQIERIFGSSRTFAIMVFLAIGSGVAEYAVLSGGIGLSGVGYGLFGLLWVLSRSDSRFFGLVDNQVVMLFIGWFIFCILLTVSNTMPIGNVAHGAGAVLGVLLGWTIAARTRRQQIGYVALISIVFIAIMAAGSVGRRYINFTDASVKEESYSAYDLAYNAYQACMKEDYYRAANLYRQALAIDDKQADWWYNLGIIYWHLDMPKKSTDAYRKACELAPENKEFKRSLENSR